jgi:Xaa-Pro aminopeptidase
MRGSDADALARDVLEKAGLGEAFGHSLGHGIGLEVHEAPRLSRVAETTLTVGAVVTIEPGAYLPEWGGVRIEDDVVLREGEAELLTHISRELIELS